MILIIFIEFFNLITFLAPIAAAVYTGNMSFLWLLFVSAIFITTFSKKKKDKKIILDFICWVKELPESKEPVKLGDLLEKYLEKNKEPSIEDYLRKKV